MKRRAALATAVGLAVLLGVVGYRAVVVAQSPTVEGVPVQFHHQGLNETAILRTNDRGEAEFVFTGRDGQTQHFTPEAMADRMLAEHAEPPNVWTMLNVSDPVGVIWVSIGLLGQLLFTGRMLVQWIASEKEKRSVVPAMFWWLSLGGSIMLLAYFLWRWDPVGLLGQAFGFIVYIRNLALIYGEQRQVSITDDADPAAELSEPVLTGARS